MGREQDRIETAQAICYAAMIYKRNLVGKKFLYFFDGSYIEVIYKEKIPNI